MSIFFVSTVYCDDISNVGLSTDERVEILVNIYLNKKQPKEVSNIIFVGDSRVVGMSMKSGRYLYVAETSSGYEWMLNEAEPAVNEALKSCPDAEIVMCFGVNDVCDIDNYIMEYNRLSELYGDKMWFASVGPVEDERCETNGYVISNEMIEEFNNKLKEGVGDRYLDYYSYLTTNGFTTQDGLHYSEESCKDIEDYIRKIIETGEQ